MATSLVFQGVLENVSDWDLTCVVLRFSFQGNFEGELTESDKGRTGIIVLPY